jgi:uncharacterized protein YbjT (DUF2867 family)
VRALVRKPEAARLPEGVEVVGGDLTVPETLDAALEGIDSVFLLWVAPPDAVPSALARIAKPGRRVVFLTSPHKTPHPFFQQPNPLRDLHARMERRIEGSGCEWTFLRPGMFAANAKFWWAARIRAAETVRWPYLGVATAPVDERDIAAVAVRALCEDGHGGAEYVLTGPQSLTQREQLRAIGEAAGVAVRMEEITREEALRDLTAVIPPPAIGMLCNAWAAADGLPAFVSPTVEELTGRPARTFADWARDRAALFRP